MNYNFELDRNKEYELIKSFCKENSICINDLLFYTITSMGKYNIDKTEDIFKTNKKKEYKVLIERIK